MAGVKVVALTLGLLACGGLGLLAALLWQPESAIKAAAVVRVQNGVTERGQIVALSDDGHNRRIIVWNTLSGVETQTIQGPLEVRTMISSPTSLDPLARKPLRTITVALPARTVTLYGETLTETVTQTVSEDTVTETIGTTEVETVTQVVTDTGMP